MQRVALLVTLLAALVLGIWLVVGAQPAASQQPQQPLRAATHSVQARESPSAARPDAEARARRLRERTAERDALRRRIAEALDARGSEPAAAAPKPVADAPAEPARRARRDASAQTADAPPASALVDRTGNHGYLARVMDRDLMPLVDECYELARAAHPDLAGTLVLDVEILGVEEIGGVVDSVAPGPENELADPELLDCVRESLLATTLPEPEQGGRDDISLHLKLEPTPAPER